MGRNKKSSEVEYLRGVVRGLEKQVRELRKELSKKSKIIVEIEEPKEKFKRVESEPTCPLCMAPLLYSDLGIKTLVHCSNETCKHRQLIKKQL